MTVSLFKSDRRLYSLTFTLGQIGAELTAYIAQQIGDAVSRAQRLKAPAAASAPNRRVVS